MPTWIAATSKEDEEKRRNRETGKRGRKGGVGGPGFFPSRFTLHASRSSGFTLLELSLVLFIIGLLVTVLVPRLGGLERARLETSAQRLAALVRYLNGEAAFRGRTYRIQYDLDQHHYGVQVLTPSQETKTFVADESPLSQFVHLPSNITFADIRVPSVGRVSSGRVFTHFYPQGYTDPTVVHLRDQQLRTMTVIIPPITGEATVYEGYVDAPH
jgi:type II secretion system protein H